MSQALTPSFDTWTSFFLLVSSLGFFLTVILSLNKSNRANNAPIVLLILGFSFILLQYVLYWTKYQSKYPFVYFFDTSWYLSFGPLLYTYITKFYNNKLKTQWFHFTPAIVVFILSFYFLIRSNGFQNFETLNGNSLFYVFHFLRSPWLAAVSFIIYLTLIKYNSSIYTTKTKSQYDIVRAKWTNLLISLFLLFTISYISYYVLVQFSFFNLHWDYAISFSMSFSIYAIGYMVYKEPSIFNGTLLSNLFLKEHYAHTLTETTKNDFFNTLIIHLKENKPYMDNTLRLTHLADQIGLSPHTLSKLINEKAQKNFNQFINEYRLEEAKKMLQKDPDTSIKTIYFDVGFNNKATFNAAFKNKFNCTPSAYKKKYVVAQDK